ncbi:hypothetical protein GETHLI_01470 [Geothrix limicola]|uniref:Signal transduction histidine kinase dimerisation/phosphoacceptor domain-containing protein n=1 Tax=Geothrix limicola TaxID=2927978 RepID=A0ABQ5QBZ0_9BACT|nr:hypothetical protein [Geothrix limicola]GLH71645.1 hypothetical protein GETHLI_01470 [Geothrix limicola]
MTSQELWRAALHDFNNLLAGLQGVLDLSDPRMPLDARNRMRLGASIEDGKTLITMARALALGRLPDPGMAPWDEWKAGLQARLDPMAELFRCPIHLADEGLDQGPSWPTPLWQDWVATFTRQVLPWSVPGPLRLMAKVEPDAWILIWESDAPMPLALSPEPPADTPKNLSTLWLRAMGERLGISVHEVPGGLMARMKRPDAS